MEEERPPAHVTKDASAPSRRLVVFLAAVGLLVVTAVGLYMTFVSRRADAPPTAESLRDPRLDYAGPIRNVHPDVRYLPDERCSDCHLNIAISYAEHPMGRSLLPVAQAVMPALGREQNNPFQASGSQFRTDREGERVRTRRTRLGPDGRPAAEQEWEIDYTIGSGGRGHSYLTARDGYLVQTPVSWYSQKQRWDLSPGSGPAMLTGRAVLPECLYCHANRARHVEGSVNRYEPPVFDGHAIGCQRCHGPGELHVASRERLEVIPVGADPTIVNPRRLERSLRDAVCEQCHLTAEARTPRRGRDLYDYRPGLPLEQFWSIFVQPAGPREGQKAVSHVEQMYQSRCFQKSTDPDPLGCISCHDPHEKVPTAARVTHYRSRCLQCHQQRGCSLSEAQRRSGSAADSCIECHMPRYGASDIPHTAATDHRILRHGKAGPRIDNRPTPGDDFPLASFYRHRGGVDPAEDDRDLAVTLAQLASRGNAAVRSSMARTLRLLDAALSRAPDDLAAGEARGYVLAVQSRWAESLAAFESVLAKAPQRETALVGAAAVSEAVGQREAALAYWRRAVVANPWTPVYQRSLVVQLLQQESWTEARPHCDAWVRLDPFSAEARAARIGALLAVNDKEAARAEFARLEALAPPNLRELQIRFEKKLR